MFSLDAYKLKWIAIIGMVLSHIAWGWQEILPMWLMVPFMASGGLTFPIMGYFVVEGYKHTSNLKGYLLRLFVFGVIAIPFYMLTFRFFWINIMFSIMLGIATLWLYDKIKFRWIFWALFIFILLPISIFFDWYIMSISMILMYYIIPNEKARRVVPAIFGGVLWFAYIYFGVISLASMQAAGMYAQAEAFIAQFGDMDFMRASLFMVTGCLAAAFLLLNFNGERGKRMKWAFYIMYPLHLAVIGLVAWALGLVDVSSLGMFGLGF